MLGQSAVWCDKNPVDTAILFGKPVHDLPTVGIPDDQLAASRTRNQNGTVIRNRQPIDPSLMAVQRIGGCFGADVPALNAVFTTPITPKCHRG